MNTKAVKGRTIQQSKPAGVIGTKFADDWLNRLDTLLRRRQVGEGFALLELMAPRWTTLDIGGISYADFLLTLAQWVDVGFRDSTLLRTMLDRLSKEERLRLSVGDYVRLQMAEAFYALVMDDSSTTIHMLDILLRLDSELLGAELRTVAHLWKARAHRKRAEYEQAHEHIDAALQLTAMVLDSQVIRAVLEVQRGWLVFQRGDASGALKIFDQAEEVLQHTDHWIALGNIESARGRIVRRNGAYDRSLGHFLQAVKFYEIRHPNHPNLARAVTNLAFVKRLLALQLKRHIDCSSSRRNPSLRGDAGNPKNGRSETLSKRPLHKQYQELYLSAITELERAKTISLMHEHHSGLAAAILNAGYLHLDVGDLDLADREASQAYEIGHNTNAAVLMARSRILSGLIENARLEELLGRPEDGPVFAQHARQHCMDALTLAKTTENKRLMVNAYLALGEVAINSFFQDYDEARRYVQLASELIEEQEADYVVDELNQLKAKLLRTVGIDNTLRSWSEGILSGKTLQQLTEEFAELVVSKVWLREGRRTARVAELLATSPKKVRRLVRHVTSNDSPLG